MRISDWSSDVCSSDLAPVVVGARSALFLPYPDLGVIVVDEEHESAFKQEDGVTYHARDMAVVRAQLGGIPAVLVSDRQSVVSGKSVSVRVDLGVRRIITTKKH